MNFWVVCFLWLLNLFLIVYSLLYLPTTFILLWVFFIACVLHELGHVVAASWFGGFKGLVWGWWGPGVDVDSEYLIGCSERKKM